MHLSYKHYNDFEAQSSVWLMAVVWLKQYTKVDDNSVEHFDISLYAGLIGGRPTPYTFG